MNSIQNKTTENKTTENQINNNKITKNKIKTLRCKQCNKKIPLINFRCKCNHLFCIKHLNPHTHNCTFDNISLKKEILKKDNPKVNNKFNKI